METSKRKKLSKKKGEERKEGEKESSVKKSKGENGSKSCGAARALLHVKNLPALPKRRPLLRRNAARNSAICLIVTALIVALAAYYVYTTVFHIPELPEVDLNVWWGPNHTRENQDKSIRPYRILFTDAMQDELVKKFELHREKHRKSFKDTAMTYGVHSDVLGRFLDNWKFKYTHRIRQRVFNQFQHYKTNIQGLELHFVRVKPQVQNVKVLPIILLHGWPSSFREFYEVIPLLTAQRPGYDFVFEVIVPSLPGFGFSQAAVRPGLSPYQMAIVMRNLMQRLGFSQYYIQGGDFGHVIGSIMATVFPDEVLGFHSNMPLTLSKPAILGTVLGAVWPTLVEPEHWQKMYPLKDKAEFQLEETGYSHLQATKPDTIGIVLNESPPGLAAYILDKFLIYTDPSNKFLKDGGLTKFNMTDLIDNVMVYWISGSITTSMRVYKEMVQSGVETTLEQIPTPVKTWFLCLKNELFFFPEIFLRWKYPNLKGITSHDFGGHFAAMERPKEFADDIFLAVKSFNT